MQPKLEKGKEGTISLNLAGLSEGVRTGKNFLVGDKEVNDTTSEGFPMYFFSPQVPPQT